MIDFRTARRRLLTGIALALLAGSPALAATYQIGLFEGATGTGSGSFSFTNPGTVGSTPVAVTLSTNASSSIGARPFLPGSLNVQVAAVNFSDGKTPPNQITGNFVEGLTGSLSTAASAGLTPTGQCNTQACFYRITFAFVANANPNAAGTKTYTIQLIRQSNGNIVDTPVPAGTYSVSNVASIPEPGTLALVAVAFAALAWRYLRRRDGRLAAFALR